MQCQQMAASRSKNTNNNLDCKSTSYIDVHDGRGDKSIIQQHASQQRQPLKVQGNNDDMPEILMGYDILTNLLNGHSNLWIVPTLRKLTFGNKLHEETQRYINIIQIAASERKKELRHLRELEPRMTDHYQDEKPNQMADEIVKNVAWKVASNLSNRSDQFDVDFAFVQITSCTLVSSTALAVLKFETNRERIKWLKEVSVQYKLIRDEMRDTMLDYIRRGEK